MPPHRSTSFTSTSTGDAPRPPLSAIRRSASNEVPNGPSVIARFALSPGELAVVFLALVFPALLVDVPVAAWCLGDYVPGELERLINATEGFGHGLGVLLIVLIIHQLDPARRWALPRLLAAAFASGMAANLVKMTIQRTRPHHFDFTGGVMTSFGGWFPLTTAGSDGQSFPSAHVATAVGLAIGLIWLYPLGRRIFPALAVMVACQRMASGAHFLSDTLFGAAVGCLVGQAVVGGGALAHWFDRVEAVWRASSSGGFRSQRLARDGRRSDEPASNSEPCETPTNR